MASSPQFFKILLPRNLEEQKLMIPKKFVQKYGMLLSSSVILKLPNGMEWKVGLQTAANGAVWLQKGWHKFAKHYCLEFGSLLVFRLDRRSSSFEVTIFDPTGVESEYSFNSNDSTAKSEEDDDSVSYSDESLEAFHGHSKKKGDSFSLETEPVDEGCNIFSDIPSSKRRMPKDYEIEVSRRRRKLANKVEATEKPGFKVVLSQSNVGGRFNMVFPTRFARMYLSEKFGNFNLQTANGRKWPLLYKWSQSRVKVAYISSGWKGFVQENLLKEGDLVFFELIKKDRFLFTKLQETDPYPSPLGERKTASTRNPFFKVDIHLKTYKNIILNIPLAFGKEHFSPEMNSAKLQVGSKEWIVTLKQYEGCIRFSAGWSKFYAANGLKDGDTCLFEMVSKQKCVFKVTIFKKFTTSALLD